MAKARIFTGVAECDVTSRKLRNGNRIKIVLELPYTEAQYQAATKLNFRDVEVSLVEYQGEELPFPEKAEPPEGPTGVVDTSE